MPDWLKFVEVNLRDGRKTRVWAVLTIDGKYLLGRIGWYAPWRKYCFVTPSHVPDRPLANDDQIILEEDCLRKIADFCQTQTRIHKSSSKLALKKGA